MSKTGRQKRLLRLSILFGAFGCVLLFTGIILSWNQHSANQGTIKEAKQKSSESSSSPMPAPSTAKPEPDTFTAYRVAPDRPRYIFIPKISVKAMVKPVGVTPTNEIDAPRNVFDAGWYTGSAKPGQPGAMVFGGHVSSWETPGIFHKLKQLRRGDTFSVERGDGHILQYEVVKVQRYAAANVDMKAVLAPIAQDEPGLNLITCAGKVIPDTNNFDQRLVVFARQKVDG